MAALTQAYNAETRDGDLIEYGVAASTTIYAGAIVALNTSGYAVPAADTANLLVMGRAEETVDNASGSAGDLTVVVRRGLFRWDNHGTPLTIADIGDGAFVADDHTVAAKATTTNDVCAGEIVNVDSVGVWVDTRLAAARKALAS